MQKDALIQLLKDCEAIKFGRFILTSGAVSDYYIDIKKASTNPDILKKIAMELSNYTSDYDLIAGMELGAVPLAVALSLETKIPYVIIRKETKGHGTGKQTEGGDVSGKKVLIVEDVTTSGGSVIKSIQILRSNNAIVDKVLVVVDRGTNVYEKLDALKVKFIPLITANEIIKK
jgi:orotate phosphoribosyltransferase